MNPGTRRVDMDMVPRWVLMEARPLVGRLPEERLKEAVVDMVSLLGFLIQLQELMEE